MTSVISAGSLAKIALTAAATAAASSAVKQPKVHAQEIETKPVTIDNSKATQQIEQASKKRRGAAMSFIAGNTSLSGNQIRKTTLGE